MWVLSQAGLRQDLHSPLPKLPLRVSVVYRFCIERFIVMSLHLRLTSRLAIGVCLCSPG